MDRVLGLGPGHAVLRAARAPADRQDLRAAGPARRPERRRCRRTALHVRQRRARPGRTRGRAQRHAGDRRRSRFARASGDGFLYEAWPAIFAAFGARTLQEELSCLGGGIQAAGGAHRRDRHPDRGCARIRAAAASRWLQSAPRALPAECWCCAGFATRATTVSGRALERSSPGGARSTSERSRCVSATFRRRRRGLLLAQHTEEAGQAFMSEAIATVWRQTQGQPWLVNALSERACFRGEASRACTRPITEPAILDAQEQLILAQRRKLKTRRNHSAGAMCGVFRSDCETARPCAVASRDSHREVAERWMNSMPWQGA